MKHLSILAAALFLATMMSGFAGAEPVAPLSTNYTKEDLMVLKGNWDMTLEDLRKTIPPREQVGIPIYPGVTFGKAFDGVVGSDRLQPFVYLMSADPPDKVREWYRKNLPGWSYDDTWYHVFYDGPAGAGPAELASDKYQKVDIREYTGGSRLFDPDAKTEITIFYKPKQ